MSVSREMSPIDRRIDRSVAADLQREVHAEV
jgi:hypothetical protein